MDNKRKSFPQLQDEAWLRKEIEAKPLRQIAEEIGSSYGAISWTARKFGIEVPQRGKHRVPPDHSANCRKVYYANWPNGRMGSQASNWRGGKIAKKGSYVFLYMPEHPQANSQGYVLEHRLVMEKALGRPIELTEMVHHKNGDRHDNRVENLEVVQTKKQHFQAHFDAVKKVQAATEETERLKSVTVGMQQAIDQLFLQLSELKEQR